MRSCVFFLMLLLAFNAVRAVTRIEEHGAAGFCKVAAHLRPQEQQLVAAAWSREL